MSEIKSKKESELLQLVRHGSADFVVEFGVCEGLNFELFEDVDMRVSAFSKKSQ